jgi:GNAT superfamily N-acetyltransferase
MTLTIRCAVEADLDVLLELIDLFTVDHPSAHHPRPREVIGAAFFGPDAVLRAVVAEERGRVIGYAGWRRGFDFFWAMWGADAEGLFVRREARGRGVAAALVARVCAEVRAGGGVFLRGTYHDVLAPLYERSASSWPVREAYLSASAFARMADLARKPIREIVKGLPAPELNRIPVG